MSALFGTLMADSEARARTGGIGGLRTGEVVGITDEGYILEWISGNVRSPSAPARMATFMAGPKRGAYFPLEIGDEVVVGFVEGHLDQPLIVGALHSDVDPPPPESDTSDTNNTRKIFSREGSELAFDDTSGATAVRLASAGGLEITLVDGSTDSDPGTLTIRLSDTARIELSQSALTVQFDDNNKIVLSQGGVTVTGSVINLN